MIFGLVVSVGSTPTKRQTQFLGNTTSDTVIRNAGLGVRPSRSESWSSTYLMCNLWQITQILSASVFSSIKWEQ